MGHHKYSLEYVLENYTAGPVTGVFTDGGCRPNPGMGAWAAIIVDNDKIVKILSGKEENSTNNNMELRAILEAYKYLKSNSTYSIYSDSNYCVQAVNKWMAAWEKKKWKTLDNSPVKNLELFQQLNKQIKQKKLVTVKWIKGHKGNKWNEYANSVVNSLLSNT